MDKEQRLFLSALKASLLKETVSWEEELSLQEWMSLFKMAEIHKVLPMVYEAVYKCPAALKAAKEDASAASVLTAFKQRTRQTVMVQTMKTMEFLNLYQYLCKAGVRPLVVKGLICRNLYPNPDCRSSSDEDLLILPEQFPACHKAMLSYGMETAIPEAQARKKAANDGRIQKESRIQGAAGIQGKSDVQDAVGTQGKSDVQNAVGTQGKSDVQDTVGTQGKSDVQDAVGTQGKSHVESVGEQRETDVQGGAGIQTGNGLKNRMDILDEELNQAYEVPYVKKGSPLYIELHKSLFSPDAKAYGSLNRFFEGVQERMVMENVQGISVDTMSYTDHLFYLICHAFKHFLHSGFGIRQICDMILFANAFGEQIDWQKILHQCQEIHAEKFTAALFQIGEKYLTFSPQAARYPEQWQKIRVDEQPLLEDLLKSGIYGGADMSRKHSSMITLNAVVAQKASGKNDKFIDKASAPESKASKTKSIKRRKNKGLRLNSSVLKTVFPSAKSLEGRFPYLKKYPILLPVAWVSRLVKYQKETRNTANNNAAESIKIGNERIELLKQYGIID